MTVRAIIIVNFCFYAAHYTYKTAIKSMFQKINCWLCSHIPITLHGFSILLKVVTFYQAIFAIFNFNLNQPESSATSKKSMFQDNWVTFVGHFWLTATFASAHYAIFLLFYMQATSGLHPFCKGHKKASSAISLKWPTFACYLGLVTGQSTSK